MDAQRESPDADLAVQLRRIRLAARLAAAVWVLGAAILTVSISHAVLSAALANASATGTRDAAAIASVVNRAFDELTDIPRVLSTNEELRAIVARYNSRGVQFAQLPPEARGDQLKHDPDVARVNHRLTSIRHDLSYDLIFVLNDQGILVASSDWNRPLALLGMRLDDRDYFKEAMGDHVGQLFAVARDTGNPGLFFSAPMEDDGRVIGAVVARQESGALGSTLVGRRYVTFVVDRAGMVAASSEEGLTLHHMGALADARPDERTLHDTYRQDTLRSLDITRARGTSGVQEWSFNGHRYIATRIGLKAPQYSLVVLSPVEQLEAVRPLHYTIGVMVTLFGVLLALLGQRRAEALARRRHALHITALYNEKLRALNAEKDRYLGIAAHDLRNPLSSVRGLSELMLETTLELDQQREFLETIRRTSDEMLGLVNDLLDTSVIESGKLDLRLSKQDLSALVRQRIRQQEPYARSKQIAIQIDAAAGQEATIDPARFAQVVDNLVSNAIKYSPSGTTVNVAVHPDKNGFVFAVQDQGPGIPEQDRALMFRTFQKLSARPTGGEKSTGLGLAIVKKIVDAHGGRIEVDNVPGGGARFTVTVPSGPIGRAAS